MEENTVIVDCPHNDYSSSISEIQTQLVEIQENQAILTDTLKGGNSLVLMIFILLFISCIYRLLKSIF